MAGLPAIGREVIAEIEVVVAVLVVVEREVFAYFVCEEAVVEVAVDRAAGVVDRVLAVNGSCSF
jgi:hypothetical protein